MDQKLSVHIITEFYGLTPASYLEKSSGLYVRLGKCVILPELMRNSSMVQPRNTLPSILMALLVLMKFYELNLPSRSIWLLKTQLSALSKVMQKKYLTYSLTELWNEFVFKMEKSKVLPMMLFPSRIYLDTSLPLKALVYRMMNINTFYMISMRKVTTSKSMTMI